MDMSQFSDEEMQIIKGLVSRIDEFLDMDEPSFVRAYDEDAEVFLPLSNGGSVASIHYTGDGLIIRSVVAGEVEYRTLNGEPAKMTADYVRERTIDTYQRARVRADNAYDMLVERGCDPYE
jgi:hypothetical protein